ncbi:hypothetical protein K466DRAFT_664216 [Polyporus arcularius HHB13444]|uniref:Uncharacterized protein n=1 Tax=Polyporus arcularius HHB13444 TaxID=1314778 RepID=A0A5C3P8K5_9APHY|nr:hypothetical protein K466DRAFT_664216 [Polyporus arcularius HHB13444]
MLSCSALTSLDSSRDIVVESQITLSPSLPRVNMVLPRSPPRLEPSPLSEESFDSQPPGSPSEEPQTARKLILRKRSTSPLQVKFPFMADRLRVRREKSASPQRSPSQSTGTEPARFPTTEPGDSEPATTSQPAASPPRDCQSAPCTGTPCDMLPVRKVRFVTPPSSPEESITAYSPREGESNSDDQHIYRTTVSLIENLPLATFPVPDAFSWPRLVHAQSAGGLAVATPHPSDGNALGLSVGPAYEHAIDEYPGLYVLPAMDTWEEICENLSCALEVCAVLADLDRSSPGSMSAVYYESQPCPAMGLACGSSGLWNCRVFPSVLF